MENETALLVIRVAALAFGALGVGLIVRQFLLPKEKPLLLEQSEDLPRQVMVGINASGEAQIAQTTGKITQNVDDGETNRNEEELSDRVLEIIAIEVDKKLESFFEDKIKPMKKDISRADAEAFSYHEWRWYSSEILRLNNAKSRIESKAEQHNSLFEAYTQNVAKTSSRSTSDERRLKNSRKSTADIITNENLGAYDFEATPITNDNHHKINPPNLSLLTNEADKLDYKKHYERGNSFNNNHLRKIYRDIDHLINEAEMRKQAVLHCNKKEYYDAP